MEYLEYKGYRGTIEVDPQDNNYHTGYVLGLKHGGISYEGDTRAELEEDFKGAIDDYISFQKADAEEIETPVYTDQSATVPIDADLGEEVNTRAALAGISVKEYVSRLIRAGLSSAALL